MYIVAYAHKTGFGNFIPTDGTPWPSTEVETSKLEAYIKDQYDLTSLAIISITPLRKWWEFWK